MRLVFIFMLVFAVVFVIEVSHAAQDQPTEPPATGAETKPPTQTEAPGENSQSPVSPEMPTTPEAPALQAQPAPEPIVLPDPAKVVVTVNGKEITEGDLETRFQQTIEKIKEQQKMDDQKIDQLRKSYRPRVMDMVVKSTLIHQEAQNNNVELTQADLDEKNEEIIQIVMKRNHWTREELEQEFMEKQGITMTESLKQFNQNPLFRESALSEKLYKHQFPGDLPVTDVDIQKFYDDNKAGRYDKPEMVRASHILIKVDEKSTDQEKQQAREKIDAILAQVKAPDADFAALAKEHSQCPSAKRGGDLSFFPQTGVMVEPFAEAAFALKPGEISGIVETKFGYHIIKAAARKAAVHIPLDEVKAEIQDELRHSKRKEKINDYVDDRVKAAQITYADESDKPAPSGKRTIKINR